MDNLDFKLVSAVFQNAGNVEVLAPESVLDTPELMSVELYLRLPVDALEMQELPGGIYARTELQAVEEVCAEQGIRYCKDIVAEVGVGHQARLYEAAEDGSRDPGRDRVFQDVTLQQPAFAGQHLHVSAGLEGRMRASAQEYERE